MPTGTCLVCGKKYYGWAIGEDGLLFCYTCGTPFVIDEELTPQSSTPNEAEQDIKKYIDKAF